MIWLLDTNVLIHAQRGRPEAVRRRLRAVSPDDVVISTITVAELWYGIARSDDPDRKRESWARFLAAFDVRAFDRAAAELHGGLRFALRHQPIGERDLLIAAIALANDLAVVTANTGEFRRVPGLHVEDWGE
ncbi:MAG TPA: type II toxin-antitoxin system VapC family toxin [Longimicrobiales bacterium]|nr:type II toxin-antitoxin system VapC family toxin [Longimicrobiales bacterium]